MKMAKEEGYQEAQKKLIVAMKNNGISLQMIAKMTNIPYSEIASILSETALNR